MHVDDVGADGDMHGHRDAEPRARPPTRCVGACGGRVLAQIRATACPSPSPRATPSRDGLVQQRPVSSAMPNRPGPSASSTSSDVAPGQRDLEVVDDAGAVGREGRHVAALHQIDEHRRQAGLDHVRADAPHDARAAAPAPRAARRRRRRNRRRRECFGSDANQPVMPLPAVRPGEIRDARLAGREASG